MKVGDLVLATTGSCADERQMGIVAEIKSNSSDAVDSMFPYFIFFTDNFPNDWYGSWSLEVISEGG